MIDPEAPRPGSEDSADPPGSTSESTLEQRVARLERLVETLVARAGYSPPSQKRRSPGPDRGSESRRTTATANASAIGASRDGPTTGANDHARAPRWTPDEPVSSAAQKEQWLARAGIGFVVLALALLLKLSFDRGWITPAFRLAAGFGVGAILQVVGLRLEPDRRRLAQILLGGSIAIFYLVGFAGHELYALIPYGVAIALMSATTLHAIGLSVRQDSSALAVIGVLGGLATPFLIESSQPSVATLAIYTCLVLIGGGAVDFYKRWLPLRLTLVFGGAAVLAAIALGSSGQMFTRSIPGLVFWMVAVASPLLAPRIRGEVYLDEEGERREIELLGTNRLVVGFGTVVTTSFLAMVFDLERTGWGALMIGSGLLLAVIAMRVRSPRIACFPAAEVAALALAIGMINVAWGSLALLLTMAEVATLLVLVSRGAPTTLAPIAHILAVWVMTAFLYFALYSPGDGLLGFRSGAWIRMGVLALFPICGRWAGQERPVYLGAAYFGLLAWFFGELADRTHGAAFVSIAWSVQGATALLVSLRNRSSALQNLALGTLGLVSAKLLLVDLAQLDPVWRILLFLGFGASLLGLGYLVNRRNPASESEPPETGA